MTLQQSNTHLVMDMPPLTRYAAYALGFTRANKATLGVQCPDDPPVGLNDELWSFLKRRPDIIGTPPLREKRPDARVRAVFGGVCVSGGAGPGCEGCGGPCAIFGREGSEGRSTR